MRSTDFAPLPRLKAQVWVQAALRSCMTAGITSTVLRHGDDDAGSVLIKQNLLGAGFCVLTPMRNEQGMLSWFKGTGAEPVAEAVADGYIARQLDRDSDLWIIEVEDKSGALPFVGF